MVTFDRFGIPHNKNGVMSDYGIDRGSLQLGQEKLPTCMGILK